MDRPDQVIGAARRDPGRAVLEGFHALKHALRFGADIVIAVTPDPRRVLDLAGALAPDVEPALAGLLTVVDEAAFARCAATPPPTGVVAVATRPRVDLGAALAGDGPALLLDGPRHHGNVGAVIRVAAGLGAAAVVTTGLLDPWHPASIRGSAGLHFAVPVARSPALPPSTRTPVACDPDGEPISGARLPGRPLLCLGAERHGLSEAIRSAARLTVSIPMRAGVSSLNLATAAAIALYEATRD